MKKLLFALFIFFTFFIQPSNQASEKSWIEVIMENLGLDRFGQWKKEDVMHSLDVTDTDLLQTFEQLKKDLKVPKNVQLRLVDMNASEIVQRVGPDQQGYYAYYSKVFYLSKKYKSLDRLYVVMALAHDLEHARQFEKCYGSYHGDDPCKREQAADASVAGYLNCPSCLRKLKYLNGGDKNKGYFAASDYDVYIARADEEGSLCKVHNSWNPFKNFTYSDYLPAE